MTNLLKQMTHVPVAGGGTATAASTKGVFVTWQSLTTFPVAAAVVNAISRTLVAVMPSMAHSKVIPVIAAFAVGVLLFLQGISKNDTPKGIAQSAVIALVNAFMLAAASLGIDSVTAA
ncbi:MAG: hypothetical protein PVI37_00420 [Gammaproteobacteria bacterium]|jgi:hypothetical protein